MLQNKTKGINKGMAKKTSEALLQEVVGQLRTLNRSSVRDQLREAEANKRAEKLMNQGEVQEEQQSMIVDGATDFQRRFLAGQAKTFLDRKTQKELVATKKHQETQLSNQETLIKNSESMVESLYLLSSHGSKPGSLYVHDLSVEKGIGEVLKQEIMSIEEFGKLGDTVGDELSRAAHISRGGVGYLSAPGRSNVDEDAYIKLADRVRKARLGESDEDENDLGEILQDAAGLGNLEDFMQGSKVKLTKDMLVERNLSDMENLGGLFSAEVVNAADPIGSKRGQRFLVPAGTEIFHPGGMADTNEVVVKGFDFSEVEVDKGSLVVHNATLLDYLKERDDELDQQRNTDLRSAEERRREAIRNAGAGAGGIGAGMGGGFGDDEEGDGGGLMDWIADNPGKTAGGAGLTLAAIFRKWFGFGTKAGFIKTMRGRFATLGAKLFPKSKYGFVGPKLMAQKGNPRMWPSIFAAGIATMFFQSTDELADEFSEGEGDEGATPAGYTDPEDGGVFTTANVLTAAVWAPIIYKSAIKTKIGQGMKTALTKSYSGAPKGTARNFIWKRMLAGGISKLGGRALAAAFGPWGMAAYIAWGIIDWRMDVIKANQSSAEDEMIDEINENGAIIDDGRGIMVGQSKTNQTMENLLQYGKVGSPLWTKLTGIDLGMATANQLATFGAGTDGLNYIGNIDQSDKRIITTETHYHIQSPTGGWTTGIPYAPGL